MKLTRFRLFAIAMIAAGVVIVAWGVQHLSDPIVVGSYGGYPLPGRNQFVAIPLGTYLIAAGVAALRSGQSGSHV